MSKLFVSLRYVSKDKIDEQEKGQKKIKRKFKKLPLAQRLPLSHILHFISVVLFPPPTSFIPWDIRDILIVSFPKQTSCQRNR